MATINYKLIKNFLTKDEVNIISKYCFNKLDHNKDYKLDGQSFSPAWYNDPLMDSLLYHKLSKVELETNLKLFPTYAYWRYYIFGATLKKHTDRPSCEISVTTCVEKYDNWEIVIDGKSFILEKGDGVLYAGCDHEHWRNGIYKGKGMAQVFFHYVDQNGIYKDHAYDQITKEII
jgi:hypothetical protein